MSRLRFSCAQSARNEHPHPQQTPSLERERSCSTALQAKVRRRVVTYLSIPPPNTERIRAAPCITSKEVGRHACPSRILHLVYLARLTLLRLQRASDCAQTAQDTGGSTQVPSWPSSSPPLLALRVPGSDAQRALLHLTLACPLSAHFGALSREGLNFVLLAVDGIYI